MNGCAPGLALIERLKATRKWAITFRFQTFRAVDWQGILQKIAEKTEPTGSCQKALHEVPRTHCRTLSIFIR